MKKIILPIVIATTFLIQSCSNNEDFLDVDQTEKISTKDLSLYNNEAGAESFVTAAYNQLLQWNTSSFSWNGISSIASDDADKGSSSGDTGTDKDQMDALTYTSGSVSVLEVFEGNYQGINRCNQALYYLPLLDQVSADLRNRLTGEAKFLRALYYWNLVRVYGGVPIVDHIPNPSSQTDTDMQLIRKSTAEVYAFIEKDLLESVTVLPTTQTEKGRATRGAAYALLAKVSLYQKKWAKVIEYANQVTGYSLVANYAEIFKLSGENNQESIFEIQSVGVNPAKGIAGYSVSQGARGAGGWGWGFNIPSQSLINAYETGDTRKAATIIFRGTTLYDGRVVASTVENEVYNYKAYSSSYTDAWEADTNIRVLRYAEVLLMLAEAYNEQGNSAQATNLLNQIRNRAGLANTTVTSQTDVRTAIWKERRVELAFEHDRFFDLVRTGQAKTALALHGKTFIEGKHEVFPLPSKFLLQANGKSSQNPGYN